MEMNINSARVKELRTSKAWSQQQLCEVASLSLRTIQRVEKTGKGSPESIQAIAAAFETSTQALLCTPTKASTKTRHRKIGWLSGGLISSFAAVFCAMTVFAPASLASHIELMAKEMETSSLSGKNILKGSVKVTIPKGMETEVDAKEMWQSGDISVFTEGARITVDNFLIVVKKGTLLYSESVLQINTEYAEVSPL